MEILKLNKDKKRYIKILLLKIHFLFLILIFKNNHFNLKKIGVIGLAHSQNIGNNLLKYAISIKLSELGFRPYIIGMRFKNHSISFLREYTKVKIINNFQEIKENDYDILMVNSDQTWRKCKNYFYDIAFLNFAKNWNIRIKYIISSKIIIKKFYWNIRKGKRFYKTYRKPFRI